MSEIVQLSATSNFSLEILVNMNNTNNSWTCNFCLRENERNTSRCNYCHFVNIKKSQKQSKLGDFTNLNETIKQQQIITNNMIYNIFKFIGLSEIQSKLKKSDPYNAFFYSKDK